MTGPRRNRSLLAPGGGRGSAALTALAVISLGACLALVLALVAGRGLGQGRERLAGAATVVVRASRLESADAAAARAAEILARQPRVARAWPQAPTGADGLTARLIDGRTDAPEPRLIAVVFDPGVASRPAALIRALAAEGLPAAVDDHEAASGPVERARIFAALAGAGGLAAATLAVALICALAVRRRARNQWKTVDLLRVSGATDRFVAGLFVGGAARLAIVGGSAGAVLAVVGLVLARGSSGYFPGLPGPALSTLAWPDLAIVAAWPPVAALAGALAARLAMGSVLARTP